MRRLIRLVIIALILASAYWAAGTMGLRLGLAGWFEQRRGAGWRAEYATLSTGGWPARFEARISGLELADPGSGLAWSLPSFRFHAPAWRPGKITALWPARQSIATPGQRIAVDAGTMRAALLLTETTDLNLARLGLELAGIALRSDRGWESGLESGRLLVEQAAGPGHAYRLKFEASGLRPAEAFLARLERAALPGGKIEGMRLDALVSFDAPWDRFALEGARPQPTRIGLERLEATSGALELHLSGELEIGPDGLPEGQIAVRARNWRQMVALARELGILAETLEPSLVSTLSFLASLSGDRDSLDTPLTFTNGYVAFGPVPLGPAPVLRLR